MNKARIRLGVNVDYEMSEVISRCEGFWKYLQEKYPGGKNVVFAVDNQKLKKSTKYITGGYIHFSQVQVNKDTLLDKVWLNVSIFQQGAVKVVEVLTHEYCHAWARAHGMKDTSRGGVYHNKVFQSIALEFGLLVGKDKKIGVITTGLSDDRYKYAIQLFDKVLTFYQGNEIIDTIGKEGKAKTRSLKAVCGCGRIIRVSKKEYDLGKIVCFLCGTNYVLEGE